MTLTEILTIIAIILAPVFAVQVQKWLELFREDRAKKLHIFKVLMATRASIVSPDHVQSLNMIDLEFRGTKYRKVASTWKTYLDHLNSFPNDDDTRQPVWSERRINLLATLLMEMGNSLGYEYDEVQIKKSIYAPVAHGHLEDQNTLIRQGVIDLLYGDKELKMNVTRFPVNDEAISEQDEIRKYILQLLEGNRSFPVSVIGKDEEKNST